MRILYVCGAGIFSGLEKITLQLMVETRAAGHEVFCLTSLWGTGEFVSRLEAEGLDFHRTWLGFISMTPRWQPIVWTLDQARRLPQLWLDFRRVVMDWKPDIIHHTNFHHVFVLACGPTRFDIPNVYHVHNAYQRSTATRLAFKFVDRYMDRFIAVSDFVRRNLLEHGLEKRKISVVLNGVPPPSRKGRSGPLWRHEFGWHEDDVVVGVVGQIGSWKGQEDFIRAIAIAQREDPRVKGAVIGAGAAEYVKYLQVLVSECCPGAVAFPGYFPDVSLAYDEIDILVVPSRCEESCPMVVAEGMSYGLPVVGTSRGGIPELLGDELQQWLVPAEDPEAVAEKILQLAEDSSLRKKVGEYAREQASRRLTLERCSDQMIAHYRLAARDGTER